MGTLSAGSGARSDNVTTADRPRTINVMAHDRDAAVKRWEARGWRFVKSKAGKPIDTGAGGWIETRDLEFERRQPTDAAT